MLQADFPVGFEVAHPVAVRGGIGDVYHKTDRGIAVKDTTLPPVALDVLRLVTGRAEVVYDLQDGFGEPFGRNLTPSLN